MEYTDDSPPCKPHPEAPHGYNRDMSHTLGRYVCDCEFWEAPDENDPERDRAIKYVAAFYDVPTDTALQLYQDEIDAFMRLTQLENQYANRPYKDLCDND